MNRNKIKAHALGTLGDMLVLAVGIAAFGIAYGLLGWANDTAATITGIFVAFGVMRMLGPIITDGFRPAINRLTTSGETTDTDKTKTHA